MSGVKVMGLESWIRESGLGLLDWKVGYSCGHFENSRRVGWWAKNLQIIRVDA